MDYDTVSFDWELHRNTTNESSKFRLVHTDNLERGSPQGTVGALDKYNVDTLVRTRYTYLDIISSWL